MAFLEKVSKRSAWTSFVVDLPASFSDTWKFTTVRHFTETDAANSKLLIDRVRTAATLTTCIATNFELWLASSFNLE
jgi:hypothetical protein